MSYRKEFEIIEKLQPKQRGTEFEILFNKICEDANISIFSRFRTADTSQEIDGSIIIYSRIFLLEAKWESEDTLAASKLYSFLGKINSKIEGTLGIFISYNRLKDNFINAFRNGIKQNCILIHGKENIEEIIDKNVDIQDFLEYCFIMASTKNRIDINVSEFVALPDKSRFTTRKTKTIKDSWLDIYNGLTNGMSNSDFLAKLETWYSASLQLSEKTINIYNNLNTDYLTQKKLDTLITKLVEKEKETFTSVLIEKLKGEYWKKFAHEHFSKNLKNHNINIPEDERSKILANILPSLNGDWDQENKVSYVIDIFYENLTVCEKEQLLKWYLDIYTDTSRQDRFMQKQFANKLFSDFKNKSFSILQHELLEALKVFKQRALIFDEDPTQVKNSTLWWFRSYSKVFADNNKSLDEFFNDHYDQIEVASA